MYFLATSAYNIKNEFQIVKKLKAKSKAKNLNHRNYTLKLLFIFVINLLGDAIMVCKYFICKIKNMGNNVVDFYLLFVVVAA